MKKIFILGITALLFVQCQKKESTEIESNLTSESSLVDKYTTVKLTTDLSLLSENEKQMIPLLIEASEIMNNLFWYEAYGEKKDSLLNALSGSEKEFAMINYGPWDRLNGNQSFVDDVGEKPLGANFYPADMTKEEFQKSGIDNDDYSFIRRDENGKLYAIPYHKKFKSEVEKAANLLKQAAELAEDEGFKKYLTLRAQALLTDDYYPSDMAWMEMKNNGLDIVIGPIENYEDQLFGKKAAHEAYVLVKDKAWSAKLEKYAAFLPELQTNLPVEAAYKKEKPGTDSDLNAYDVVYYAGDCNSGSKTIAINLPNDERVQLEKGTRRLQLKNAMKAKFDKILVPISKTLIDSEQQQYITFDAFFANTMFHEVAHGLGIKNTINGKGTVREALKENYSALEEGKADILGLYMVNQLHAKGELKGNMKEYMTTFMASIFRSVRFGASSAHGKANMIRFNFFKEKGAFTKNEDGTYKVNYEKMKQAMDDLSELILTLQGNGDYEGVAKLVSEKGNIPTDLQKDLDKLNDEGIPVDIVYEQGVKALGL